METDNLQKWEPTDEDNLPDRKNMRYRGFDYSECGAYMVTICTNNRQRLFGEVVPEFSENSGGLIGAEFKPSSVGKMIEDVWNRNPDVYDNVENENYVIMPDHFHAIIVLKKSEIKRSLDSVVEAFKSVTDREYKKIAGKDAVLWQRNFYDSILDSEKRYINAVNYIIDNPVLWAAGKDKY